MPQLVMVYMGSIWQLMLASEKLNSYRICKTDVYSYFQNIAMPRDEQWPHTLASTSFFTPEVLMDRFCLLFVV